MGQQLAEHLGLSSGSHIPKRGSGRAWVLRPLVGWMRVIVMSLLVTAALDATQLIPESAPPAGQGAGDPGAALPVALWRPGGHRRGDATGAPGQSAAFAGRR